MPILAQTPLLQFADTSNLTSYTTGSISPQPDHLLLAHVYSSVASGTANTPTLTGGGGLTWVLAETEAAGSQTHSLFHAMKPSTGSGTVTADFAGQTQTGCIIIISDWPNVQTSGPNGLGAIVQTRVNSGTGLTTITVTLGVIGAGNIVGGGVALGVADAPTPGSGFTALGTATHVTPSRRLQTQWKDSADTTVDWSWTTSGAAIGIAYEIAAASEVPVIGSTARRKPKLGRVRHAARTSSGSLMIPVLENWEAIETANGGFMGMSGRYAANLLKGPFGKITDGATLRTYLDESNEVLWAGRLLDPVHDGVWAQLTGQGWGMLPDFTTERLLYASAADSDWVSGSSPPISGTDTSDNVRMSASEGVILMESNEGQFYAEGELNRLVFPASGSLITRITGTFTQKAVTDPEDFWDLYVQSATFPNGAWSTVQHFDLSGANTFSFDIACPGDDMIALVLERIDAGGGTSAGYWIRITGQMVFGIADGRPFTASDVARDICGRLGVSPRDVQEVGGDILPLDIEGGTHRQPLDVVSAIIDGRWCIRDTGAVPIMDFGHWGRHRRWKVLDPERQFHPVPQTRFRSVKVPFTRGSGKVTEFATAVSEDPTLPRENQNVFNLPMTTPFDSEQPALAVAQALIPELSRERAGGWARFVTIGDALDNEVSALKCHAGDLYDVNGQMLRGVNKRMTDEFVDIQFDDTLQMVRRVQALAELHNRRTGNIE